MIPENILAALTDLQNANDAEIAAMVADVSATDALVVARDHSNETKERLRVAGEDKWTKLQQLIDALEQTYGSEAVAPAVTALRGFFKRADSLTLRKYPHGTQAAVNWQSWLQILIQILQVIGPALPVAAQKSDATTKKKG